MPIDPSRAQLLATSAEQNILKVGITGHQRREGANWLWVRTEIRRILATASGQLYGWSSLAAGADQIFADEVVRANGRLIAVIPTNNYERFFESQSELKKYKDLLALSHETIRLTERDPQLAFFAASQMIIDNVELLIAVWDEEPSHGLGGTADVVEYAKRMGRQLVLLNPIDCYEQWLAKR